MRVIEPSGAGKTRSEGDRAIAFSRSRGFEGRGRSAIGAQHGASSAQEPKVDATAGAIGMLTVGDFVLFAELGPSAVKMQSAEWKLGIASLGDICALFWQVIEQSRVRLSRAIQMIASIDRETDIRASITCVQRSV
jgi:hypothetical protein